MDSALQAAATSDAKKLNKGSTGSTSSGRAETAANALAKAAAANKDSMPSGSGKSSSAKTGKSGAKSERAAYEAAQSAVPGALARTTLTHSANPGDVRVQVSGLSGFKKGMRVVVGHGANTELRLISGFGSILLEPPLVHAHAPGAPVVGFAPTTKGAGHMDHYISAELARGVLDDVLDTVLAIGDETLAQLRLNAAYEDRPMPRHQAHLAALEAMLIPGHIGALVEDSSCGRLLGVDQGTGEGAGGLAQLELRLGGVELLSLFEELSGGTVLSGRPADAHVLPIYALLDAADADARLQGLLAFSTESQGASSIEKLVVERADSEGMLNWLGFRSLFRDAGAAGEGPGKKAAALKTTEIRLLTDLLDDPCLELLMRLFHLADFDGDEAVSEADARGLFAELDGELRDSAAFSAAVEQVTGDDSGAARLSPSLFVNVRELFCQRTGTHPGGCCLLVRLLLLQAADSLRRTTGDSTNASENMSATRAANGRPVDLLAAVDMLPAAVRDALVPAKGLSLREVVARGLHIAASGVRPFSAVVDDCCGLRRDLAGATARLASFAAAPSLRAAQVLVDEASGRTLVLAEDGMAHAFEGGSGEPLYSQRLVWAEGVPTRPVEGAERFLRWREDAGLGADGGSAVDAEQLSGKARENMQLSAALTEFALTAPSSSGGLLVHDPAAGLVVVNASLVSESICLHDALSLRRIFRIRAPARLSSELTSALLDLHYGTYARAEIRNWDGVVADMRVCAARSVLLARVLGRNSILAVSLLTGASLAELSGHSAPVTCLCLNSPGAPDLIFTGSADQTVRVWSTEDAVPWRQATVGTLEDAGVARLESQLASSAAPGATSRQMLRQLATLLGPAIGLQSAWRAGAISGFLRTAPDAPHSAPPLYTHAPATDGLVTGVEVTFRDYSTQVYSNLNVVRSAGEALSVPDGPPQWAKSPALLRLGQPVAVWEVDPCNGAHLLTRFLRRTSAETVDGESFKALLEEALAATNAQTRARAQGLELDGVLQAVGLATGAQTTLFRAARRLFSWHEMQASRCDRVLRGHSGAVAAVHFCAAARLLVSVDTHGAVLVWDPCGARASLVIAERPTGTLAWAGSAPFSLVNRVQLPGALGAGEFSVAGLDALRVWGGDSLCAPFPAAREQLARAFAADARFPAADVTLRCLVFVFRDQTTLAVPVSAFAPALVLLHDADSFFCGSQCLVGPLGAAAACDLQRVFLRRQQVYRIVYAVSTAHARTEKLVVDLGQYNVLQKGYNRTPSENLEVATFERDAGWFERADSLPPATDAAVLAGTATSMAIRTGIVHRVLDSGWLAIALDFSNDVVRICAFTVSYKAFLRGTSVSFPYLLCI
jgi:hypothetical protein